ncbi:MAG: TonB-dependent receptor, partial [Pseudomonadota bacterium]
MKFTYKEALLAGAFALGSLPLAGVAQAQDDEEAVQETVFVTGSRGAPRTLTDSPVPVDVFSEEDINAISFTDTNDILRTLVPSYTLSRQPISDGASFIRPAQLRGLPTDKTLVLVNSKRRHRAALVSIGGSGAQGPDIATIPASALKTVEVLRDGASAQYGSDAIAGVINFILKDNPEGGTLTFDIGEYYEGDGTTYTIGGNIGIPLGDKGFVSVSGEITDQESTVRAEQYCESFSCVDVNDPRFLEGVDTTVTFFDEETFIANLGNANIGEGDVVQPWGVPNATAMRLFVNAGYQLTDDMELYAFGNVSDSKSDGSFFYRDPGNGTIEDIRLEDGSLWSPLATFPGGFTPRFNGDVIDYSGVGGLKGQFENGFGYDFSARYGYSEIEYTLENTINPSLGPDSPTTFQPGDLSNAEFQLQADFTQEFEMGLSSPLLFAFGASYLDETYEVIEGEPASYEAGPFALPDPFGFCETDMMGAFTGNVSTAGQAVIDAGTGASLSCADSDMDGDFDAEDDAVFRVVGVGSNGFPGYSPAFSEEYTRDSYGIYAEASADVTDRWFLQGAVRFEDYSDFGSETVYKVATQFDITDAIGIRSSYGTGFRAPTPGQQGTTNVSTRLPNGFPVATGLFPAGGTVAQALGAEELKP